MFTRVAALLIVASLFVITPSQPRPGRKTQTPWPAGYWPSEKSQPIIEKTQTIRLAPDLARRPDAVVRISIAKRDEGGRPVAC